MTDRGRAWSVLDPIRTRIPEPLEGTVGRLLERDILLAASSLAFYGLISLLPLLLIAFSVVDAVAGSETLRRFTVQTMQSGSPAVGSFISSLTANSSSLSWFTVLVALWPATAYGGGLRRALVRTAEEDEELPGLRGRMLGLGMVFALPTLVLAGVPLTFVLVGLGRSGWAVVLAWGLALVVGVVVGTLFAAVLYRVFAPEPFALWDIVRTSLGVAVITTIFSLGFAVYLRVGSVEQRFGGPTTGAVVLMGVWLFVTNVLLLAGHQALVEAGDED
ncbi:MAG: YhjD/YihY/BrkB family envelope integrity protein [Nitriliruptorales bacterium]|nr:YhjD/YihY/BrkB family envelope integrity protein [Nitriliruptorales bacterium]